MGTEARVHGGLGGVLWALRGVAAVVPVMVVLGAVTPVFAAPVAGARYSGVIIPHGVGKLGVGFMATTDRRSFEPPGVRDWQGAHVRASRSLPCVGGDEWQFGGPSGTRVTSSGFAVAGTAGHGEKTLRLRGRFVGASRAIVRLDSLRGRCPMTTVDPDTLVRDPEVLKDIGRRFGGRLALNADVLQEGVVAVGDAAILVYRERP